MSAGMRAAWALVALAIGVQILYPVTAGAARDAVTVTTVLTGVAAMLWHAALTRGARWTGAFLAAVTGGSFAVELLGVATGWPFGGYHYAGGLGPQAGGVPLLVPLAWTMLAYPAWLAAGRLAGTRLGAAGRVAVAAWALATWDLFLDPQMVAAGRWGWRDPHPALPGVPGVPIGNYLGWLGLSLVLMAAVAVVDTRLRVRAPARSRPADAPPLAFYLWTYAGSLAAHALFLGLPGSAWWGGLAMGTVAVPLAVRLTRAATRRAATRRTARAGVP
ncbi:MAG TPA: carotenoid biosynthesis protein [Micromonosporaceae bacterium]|nr:carotenoid biosynthesis protein [Micromonosporaceae bacterium]